MEEGNNGNNEEDGQGNIMESSSSDAPHVDQFDSDGATPLHIAILHGQVECVKELLRRGADVNLPCDGNPPIHMAVCQGAYPPKRTNSLEICKILLSSGASTYERDDQGRSPLHWAAFLGLVEIADLLLKNVLNEDEKKPHPDGEPDEDNSGEEVSLIELQDRHGDTPLHLCARYHHPKVIETIFNWDPEAGCSGALHTTNKQGFLPLHSAAMSGCLLSTILIAKHAPDTACALDRRNQTPEAVARIRGHKSIAETLRRGEFEDMICQQQDYIYERKKTYLMYPRDSLDHKTVAEPILRGSSLPPENVRRLHVLVKEGHGILQGSIFSNVLWDENPPSAQMADVLRVHSWSYISSIQEICDALKDGSPAVAHMDGDTAISKGSLVAALKAAGSVCRAVDQVIDGKAQNAFCIVRPPGHHAGPLGKVTCKNEPSGTNGFCLLNNIAIGAAYALNVYRNEIKRVAILDFDVHHGNGTEACVKATQPTVRKVAICTPYSEGIQMFKEYQPWLGDCDRDCILFGSVQAYGFRSPLSSTAWIYPGSGATSDNRYVFEEKALLEQSDNPGDQVLGVSNGSHEAAPPAVVAPPVSKPLEPEIAEDPDKEFAPDETQGDKPNQDPRIVNVGIPGPGLKVSKWKRAWRDKIIPAVVNFNPDMIFLSAGFDAHRKDELNHRFIGLQEEHYEWITDQLVQVANRCCRGRIISALEGGYRIHGENVSAFARSVAAHVSALMEDNSQKWDENDAQIDRDAEKAWREKRQRERDIQKQHESSGHRNESAQAHENPGGSLPRPKRIRGNVDYAELNKVLEAELAFAREQKQT